MRGVFIIHGTGKKQCTFKLGDLRRLQYMDSVQSCGRNLRERIKVREVTWRLTREERDMVTSILMMEGVRSVKHGEGRAAWRRLQGKSSGLQVGMQPARIYAAGREQGGDITILTLLPFFSLLPDALC